MICDKNDTPPPYFIPYWIIIYRLFSRLSFFFIIFFLSTQCIILLLFYCFHIITKVYLPPIVTKVKHLLSLSALRDGMCMVQLKLWPSSSRTTTTSKYFAIVGGFSNEDYSQTKNVKEEVSSVKIPQINRRIDTGWPINYRKYILQITQPSQYRYAK